MAIKVYGHPFCPETTMVICCLKEMQLEYQLFLVDYFTGAHKELQYLNINPTGQVPSVVEDGELTLLLPRDLPKYLAERYKGHGTHLLGNSPTDQILVEQCCEVEAGKFHFLVFNIFRQVMMYRFHGFLTHEALVEVCVAELNILLDVYEERLSNSKYLAGDFFSLADVQHLPWTHYLVTVCNKGDLISSRRHVSRWWEDISGRPSWKKVVQNMPYQWTSLSNFRCVRDI